MDASVIIPVYNVAPYIEDCLQSVMRQTYAGSMECLIVDDGGIDESIPIAERMIAEYDGPIRFEIIHHKHNRGLSAARNTGMEKAVGDYIFFLDSDDEITEDCLERMMAVVREHPEVDLVQGRHICYQDGKGSIAPKEIKITNAKSNDEVRRCFNNHGQVIWQAWNKLMRRSIIKESHIAFYEGLLWEDAPWTFCWLKYVKNAWFLAEVTYRYKIRPGSVVTSTDINTKEVHRLKGYHKIITHLTPGYETQEIERVAPSFIRKFLHHSYHIPELKEDLKVYWHYAWGNRSYKLCAALAICYVVRRSKWLGRIVYSLAFGQNNLC